MDEKEITSQSNNSEPIVTNKWAKRAIWCVGFGYLVPLAWWVLMWGLGSLSLFQSYPYRDLMYVLFMLSVIIGFAVIIISMMAGLIIGVIALRDIALNREELRGKRRAVTAIVLSSISLSFIAGGIILSQTVGKRDHSMYEYSRNCDIHLSELGKALKIYADEHGAYPAPDKWCDILLQGKYATEDIFKCPGNKKARCSYSMNPNCRPNSPPDIVLIFESKGGWNSYGGPELFTTENHDPDGHILLNDGSTSYLMKDPNGFPYDNNGNGKRISWGEKGKGRDLK
jgi:hypothetical protein